VRHLQAPHPAARQSVHLPSLVLSRLSHCHRPDVLFSGRVWRRVQRHPPRLPRLLRLRQCVLGAAHGPAAGHMPALPSVAGHAGCGVMQRDGAPGRVRRCSSSVQSVHETSAAPSPEPPQVSCSHSHASRPHHFSPPQPSPPASQPRRVAHRCCSEGEEGGEVALTHLTHAGLRCVT